MESILAHEQEEQPAKKLREDSTSSKDRKDLKPNESIARPYVWLPMKRKSSRSTKRLKREQKISKKKHGKMIKIALSEERGLKWMLERDEKRLAKKLRKVCTPYGDERESKLNESSEILFSMGRLYLKKAEATTGMEQKLNFIKAAALLHGARVRFEIFLRDERRVESVWDALEQMERCLLNACPVQTIGTGGLMELSKNLKRQFQILRKVESSDLQGLEIIPENISEVDANEKQLKKIDLVQYMMKQNSANFLYLMRHVAQKCLDIVGKPPCHFAIAGLGSLARQEITLYSDFEHVIILDEGLQDSPEYENIKDYFRWFAVIFEVIIIGLGETIIRSVGVKSLNDLYSSDKTKNWFYDMFTPSGVSIDGMMPHACKTPLGRQELTKVKGHVLELIRPASQMSYLLTSLEDLKNGYNLKDVLHQSGFVFGCEAIFRYFKRQAENVLLFEDDNDGLDAVRHFTMNNVNAFVRGATVNITTGRYGVDSKSSFYRPLSALLSYLGRLKKSYNMSSFEVISTWIDQIRRHDLSWAFAVACELRMKMYAFGTGNRIKVINRLLSQFVGPTCLFNCIKHVTDLSLSLNNPGKGLKIGARTEHIGTGGAINALLAMERYKEAGELLQSKIKMLQNDSFGVDDDDQVHMVMKSEHHLALCCYAENLKSRRSEKFKSFDKARQLLKSCDGYSCGFECSGYLYDIYRWLGQYREAVEVVQNCLERGAGDNIFTMFPINCLEFGGLILTSYTDPSLALNYCEDALMKYDGIHSQLAFKYGRVLAMVKCGMEDGRKELFDFTVDVVENRIKDLDNDHLLLFLDEVFMEEMRNKWWKDALYTMETGRILLESKFQEDDAINFASYLLSVNNATISYLRNLELENDFPMKYQLFGNVVRSCGHPESILECEGPFCYYLNVRALHLLLHMDSEATLLLKYSQDLKPNDLDNFDVRTNVMSQLLLLLGFYRKKIFQYHEANYDTAEGLNRIIEKFGSVLSHPLFANILGLLSSDVNNLVEEFRRRIEDTFDEPVYSDKDHTLDVFNCYETFEPEDYQNLDDHILMFEQMKFLKYKLDDFFLQVVMKLYLFGESFICKRYDEIVTKWFMADIEGCIHGFWKILNYDKEDFRVWTRSATMFCHSVVVMLGMKFYYHSRGRNVTFIERQQIVEWPFLATYAEDES